jgi:3-oxoacyl-[acyl-carrier protein] reductase
LRFLTDGAFSAILIGKFQYMNKLKDKVAIVTGASKGIGAGIARQLAADGAKVVVNYASSKNRADMLVAEIGAAGGSAVAVGADVTKQGEVESLIKEAIENSGR